MDISPNTRLHIRISQQAMAFAAIDPSATTQAVFEPYVVKSSMSMAANLREAFRSSPLLNRGYDRAQLVVDTPTMLIPLQEFEADETEQLYHHVVGGQEGCAVATEVLPHLNAVVAYAVNRDLRMVTEDHFSDVRLTHLMTAVWGHMLSRSYAASAGRSALTGHRKLYVYFHDKKVEVFSFDKNRFRFCNTFDDQHSRDAVFFVLHVWKQLALDAQTDELYLAYATPQPDMADERQERDWTKEALRRFVAKVYTVNPAAEFNRAPVTQVKGMPFDLAALLLKTK